MVLAPPPPLESGNGREAFSYPATLGAGASSKLSLSLPIFLPRHHQLILPPPFGKFKPRRSVQQEGTARISDPQSGPSSCLSPPRTNARRRKSFSAQVRQEIRDKISKKGEIFPSESTAADGESKLPNCLSHREGGHHRDVFYFSF